MPASRKEAGQFRRYLVDHEPIWTNAPKDSTVRPKAATQRGLWMSCQSRLRRRACAARTPLAAARWMTEDMPNMAAAISAKSTLTVMFIGVPIVFASGP